MAHLRLLAPALSSLFAIACSSTDTPSIDAAPGGVTLENLSAKLSGETVQCATNGAADYIACPDYIFRFVLRNDSETHIEVVDHLRLAFGTEELDNQHAGICTLDPWRVSPGAVSPLLTVHFTYTRELQTDGEFQPRFYFECADVWTRAYAPGDYAYGEAMPPLPTAGTVTLQVEGILADGAPFLAAAPVVLNP